MSLARLLTDAAPGPWEWMGGYPQRITNGGAILVAEVFNDPDSVAHDARLIALCPETTAFAIHVFERYAHQFDTETLAMWDDLNQRAQENTP